MRIRLDKLFLSAGLALAVIATTIPVGAATQTSESTEVTGWVIDGKSYLPDSTELAGAMATAVTGYTKDGSISNSKLGTGKVTNVAFSGVAVTPSDSQVVSDELKAKVDGLTRAAGFTLSTPTVTVISTYTIPVKAEYTKTVIDGNTVTTTDQATEANKAAAVAAINDAAGALKTAAKTEAEDSAKGITATVTATAITESVFSDSEVAAKEGDEAVKASVTKDVTFTEELIYTLDSLPSNITYDYLTTNKATSSDVYSVYYEKTNGQSWNTGSYDLVNSDNAVLVHVNDFTGKIYYIYKGVQSATGALLFAPTTGTDKDDAVVTSGNYTATISNEDDNAELKAQVAEGDKYVSTFSISVTLNGGGAVDSTTSPITFKIAVPQDLPAVAEGYTRTFKVIRAHDNNGTTEYTTLDTTFDGTYIIFESDVFSDYALVYSDVAAETPAEDPTTAAPANEDGTQAAAADPEAAKGAADKSDTGVKGGDNSMMPLFMTTLLLALCAGSLAIYKEKKTN